jgi:hypothetical protein
VRRVVLVVLAMTLVSCGTESLGQITTTTQGFIMGRLTCSQELVEHSMGGDFYTNAMGFETVPDAIEAFRLSEDWRLHEDWHTLSVGDMSMSPVEFTDERGWVYLVVEVARINDTWLVSGYETCAPRGD